MADLLRYLPTGALYVFALAAQVSGYTSPTVALLLAVVGTIFLTLPTCHHAKKWHDGRRRRGMAGLESWYFIVPCLVVAAVAIAGAAYGFGLRSANLPLPPPQKSVYLKDAHIYAGSASPPMSPRFEAKFARNGQRGRLFVDERYYVAGLLGASAWVKRPRIFLKEFKDFVAEQGINEAILTPFDNDGRKLWRWGQPTEQPDVKTTFTSSAWHRGRLMFISDDDAPPEYFYFIIDMASSDVPPPIVGQTSFDFVQEWEKEDEQQK